MNFQSRHQQQRKPQTTSRHMNSFGFGDNTNSWNTKCASYNKYGNNRNILTNNMNKMKHNHPNHRNHHNPNHPNHPNHHNHHNTQSNMNRNEINVDKYCQQNYNQYIPKDDEQTYELQKNNNNNPNHPNNTNYENHQNLSYLSSDNLQKLNESYGSSQNDPFNFPCSQKDNNTKITQSENININRFINHNNNNNNKTAEEYDIDEDDDINDIKYGKNSDIKYALTQIEEIKKELKGLKQEISTQQSENQIMKQRVENLQQNKTHQSKQHVQTLYSENNNLMNKTETLQNRTISTNNRKRKFNDVIGNQHDFISQNKKRRVDFSYDLKFSG